MRRAAIDVLEVRRDFPMLEGGGSPLVYLDSAATSLKPRAVIRAVVDYYERYTANVGRAVHRLSAEASARFEEARRDVADFLNATPLEIVFVRNATEALNLVARSLPADARVLTTLLEHHSNLLPWRTRGSPPVLAALHPDGRLDLRDFEKKLRGERPALVAIAHVSNAFGVVQPVETIIELARSVGARVLLDGSQSVPHRPVDVQALDADYLCFSGHKMCGPGGIGVLYAKPELLEEIEPLFYGGDMVSEVDALAFRLKRAPHRLEAGTPPVEAVLGLGAACRYLSAIGMEAVEAHESDLVSYALSELPRVPGLALRGPLSERAGSVSFTLERVEAHAAARMLSNRFDIHVRSGFHCAEPAHEALSSPATVRASFYLYNTREEVDRLREALSVLSAV